MQAQYLEEAAQRRALHNQLVDLKGAIRVFCRVRPLLAKERAARLEAATTCNLLTNTITVTGNRSDTTLCAMLTSCHNLYPQHVHRVIQHHAYDAKFVPVS